MSTVGRTGTWHSTGCQKGNKEKAKKRAKKKKRKKKKRQVACIGTSEAARVQEATHQGELPRRMILEVRTGTGFGKENRE